VRSLSVLLFAVVGASRSGGAGDTPPLPPAHVVLRIDATEPTAPWKMVVTNNGDVPVRFAADGRLLSLEMPSPEDPYAKAPPKKAKPRPPVVCKLPAELRSTGVVEDRAVVLAPGARYEEVVNPALYCFSDAAAKALLPGATVVAKLGFAPPAKPRKNAPPAAPFVVEPATANATVSAVKELVSDPVVIPTAGVVTAPPAQAPPGDEDPKAPRIELRGPARVDTPNELTVGMTLTIKNVGGRPIALNVRRDNMMFDIDGPAGSAHCGEPVEQRAVPVDSLDRLAAGASRKVDVWVGEMCADSVFDRPGLYRIWPSLAFPISSTPGPVKAWSETVTVKDPILVRVREGRLPFYASPPQVFGSPR